MNAKVEAAKKELQLEKLRRAEEHVQFEQRMSLLEAEKLSFQEEKIKIEEASKRVNQQGYGSEKLIELEVQRRIEVAMKENIAAMMKKPAVDEDEKALKAFIQYRNSYQIDYNKVCDEDVLVDAMNEADSLMLQKMLMRYRRLKNEAKVRDQKLANRILKNYFSCIRKVGVLTKKQESSFFDKWDQRFVVLSNAGLIYFSSEKLQTEEDLKPQNFKPLNDFVVTVAGADVSLSEFALILYCLGIQTPQACLQNRFQQGCARDKGYDVVGADRARYARVDQSAAPSPA